LIRTWIERVPASELNRSIDAWKQMRREGWDVTVLITPDRKTVIVLAVSEPWKQLALLA
jgi:hypothetical protein